MFFPAETPGSSLLLCSIVGLSYSIGIFFGAVVTVVSSNIFSGRRNRDRFVSVVVDSDDGGDCLVTELRFRIWWYLMRACLT